MTEEGIELLPGGLRHGRTIRVGDTVRKPAGPWTPTIHSLLEHLATKSFPAPRALGMDDEGREVLSYIEGHASIWPWPEALRALSGIAETGRILRQYHEAVRDFVPPAPCTWQDFESRAPRADEVVCHGDFGPYNIIWKGSEIAGVIDWEFARPALPLRDLAWAAFTCVPLRRDDGDPALIFRPSPGEARQRLIGLLRSYGYSDRANVIDTAIALREESTEKILSRGRRGFEPWKTLLERGEPEGNALDNAWLAHNRDLLLRD